jgi:DNA (cytosine-5)-methyltransferase 1
MKKAIGIELFAGCGGLSTGFLDAGLHVVAGYEIDKRAVDVYNYNHSYRGSVGFEVDLSTASGSELLQLAGIKSVDFMIGGPPCQPFSIAGKMRGSLDSRADLVRHYVRLVGELEPSAFVFENVPNLAAIDDGKVLKKIKASLARLGYSVQHQVVSAASFGVPQNRKRLLIIGFRGKCVPRFPAPTHGIPGRPAVSCSEAIGDLPTSGEFGETGVFNHEPTAHSRDMIERLHRLEPGKRERGSFHDRLHPDRPSYTLRAGSGNFSPLRPVHYSQDRVITVRESARLQGFSDDFIWPDRVPRLQQYRQVGNAVPPPFARAVALCLAEQMSWKLHPDEFRGDPSSRPAANVLSDSQRVSLRQSRTRGASLGRAARLRAQSEA